MKELFKEHEEAKLVKNRYKTIRYALYEEYNELISLTSKERFIDLIKDILYTDRKLRSLTGDIEQEEKQILSQQWQVDNNYEPQIKLKL